ncbi:hypothetical protein V502_08932 [Pseudogymnoascus sp. VKM F-4520 (FW-2644)]|nr:hypothetical protein V502_08932 [Pseudogymnoascus sp. VKM F-4520 (FW-2644)]
MAPSLEEPTDNGSASASPSLPKSNEPVVLEIAIAGGGIAGLTAAIALLKHPLINVTIYEQAHEIREIGASIGLGPNGLRTLEALGIENALGGDVFTTKKHFTARYHRAHLQAALLENLPRDIVHLNKKIKEAKADAEEGVTLSFMDGTTAFADILIGADGLHSNTRKSFVPDHSLHWTGWVAYRTTFDMSLVQDIKDLPVDAAHWIGHERTFFQSRLGKNQYVIVGGFDADPADPDAPYRDTKWHGEGDVREFQKYYQDWHPTVRELIERAPNVRLYPNMAGKSLETYVFSNRVTLIGDAAHTHGGAFAAGGSLAIDDAYCFSLALNHVFPINASRKPDKKELAKVFKLLIAKQKDKVDVSKTETDEGLKERIISRPDPAWIVSMM